MIKLTQDYFNEFLDGVLTASQLSTILLNRELDCFTFSKRDSIRIKLAVWLLKGVKF